MAVKGLTESCEVEGRVSECLGIDLCKCRTVKGEVQEKTLKSKELIDALESYEGKN